MGFDIYGDDTNAFLKLDSRTKLLIMFCSLICSVNSFDMTPIVIYNSVLCFVVALCGEKWFALKAYVVLVLSVFLKITLTEHPGSVYMVPVLLSGIVTILIFGFPVVVAFYLLIKTTRISQFLAAFQAMKLPVVFVIPFAVMFRFIPTVQEEFIGIRKAMAFRGIQMDFLSILKAPFRTIEYVLVPMLFSGVSVMEEMAAAALARGMDSEVKRTSYEKIKLRPRDYLVGLLFLGLAVMMIWCRRGL